MPPFIIIIDLSRYFTWWMEMYQTRCPGAVPQSIELICFTLIYSNLHYFTFSTVFYYNKLYFTLFYSTLPPYDVPNKQGWSKSNDMVVWCGVVLNFVKNSSKNSRFCKKVISLLFNSISLNLFDTGSFIWGITFHNLKYLDKPIKCLEMRAKIKSQ